MSKEKTITIKLEDFNNLMQATTNARLLLDKIIVNSIRKNNYKRKK